MSGIRGFGSFGRSMLKSGRSPAGRAITASRAQRVAAAAREKELADKLAALLATAPKPEPPPAPKPVVQPEPIPAPLIREPTPAEVARELERVRGEELRLAQVAADITVELLATWQQIEREGEAVRRAHVALGVPADEARGIVFEFTPTCASKCEKCGYPMRYTTDWRAPECPRCRPTT